MDDEGQVLMIRIIKSIYIPSDQMYFLLNGEVIGKVKNIKFTSRKSRYDILKESEGKKFINQLFKEESFRE